MKRWLSAGLTAVVVATGLTAGPVQPAMAAECTPRVELLPRFEDGRDPGNYGPDGVFGLGGHGRLVVGQTNGRQANWQDGKLKLVPLPAGYLRGAVTEVNQFGLMVGIAYGVRFSFEDRAFRYWPRQRAVDFYPKGVRPDGINDAGRVVVGSTDGTAYEYWHGTQTCRTLRVPGSVSVHPTAINNAGEVVGAAYINISVEVAVSWPADVTMLGRPMAPLTDPDLYAYLVLDIDQRGRAVGYQDFATNGVPPRGRACSVALRF